jgi:hypothetical protein
MNPPINRRQMNKLMVHGLMAGALPLALSRESSAGGIDRPPGDRPPFDVRAELNRPDRVYARGEAIIARIRSEQEGLLYLFYEDVDGQVSCLYPNTWQSPHRINAGQTLIVPSIGSEFRLRVGPPFGRDALIAVVTRDPIPPEQLGLRVQENKLVAAQPPRPLNLRELFAPHRRDLQSWAASRVELQTVEMRRQRQHQPRRVGLFVGIRTYEDPSIRPLRTSDRDAVHTGDTLAAYGDIQPLRLVRNEQATRHRIKAEICKTLVNATAPGDTVFIYWSGHGWRFDSGASSVCCLVPYDAQRQDPSSMIDEGTFIEWIDTLADRRLILIFDVCYGGGKIGQVRDAGQTRDIGGGADDADEPGIVRSPQANGQLPLPADAGFPFLDRLYTGTRGIKDPESREIAKLASAQADQLAYQRVEGDLAVMTYYLNDLLRERSEVTLEQAHKHVEQQVPAYLWQARIGAAQQKPVLLDRTTPPVFLRPPFNAQP